MTTGEYPQKLKMAMCRVLAVDSNAANAKERLAAEERKCFRGECGVYGIDPDDHDAQEKLHECWIADFEMRCGCYDIDYNATDALEKLEAAEGDEEAQESSARRAAKKT